MPRRSLYTDKSTAEDVGAFITNAALLRVLTRPQESAEDTAALVLAFLLCTLEPSQT